MARKQQGFDVANMTGKAQIETERIPAYMAEQIGSIALRGFMAFLQTPNERTVLEAKKAEIKNRKELAG